MEIDDRMVVNTKQVECPVCGQYTSVHDLGRAGLTPEELLQIRQYIKDGTLGKMLTLADLVNRRIDPTTTSMELSFNETLEKFGIRHDDKLEQLIRTLSGISEKIVGPGIGEISELIAAQEFMQTFPKDEFDTTLADKHGTDIIATVIDRKNEAGKISISIKNTKVWKNEFVQQLEKNTGQDSAKVGILISKKLPKRANPKGEVIHQNGRMFCLVSPEYGIASYAALRQVVINLHDTRQYIDTKEKELAKISMISKALAKWITSQEYRNLLSEMERIDESREKIQDFVDKKVNYELTFEKNVKSELTKIHQRNLNASSFLINLEELLQNKESSKN